MKTVDSTGLRTSVFMHDGVSAILAATGVTRSRAYELAGEVLGFLPSPSRRVGRPRAAAEPPRQQGDGEGMSRAVLRFVMTHPGCVYGHGARGGSGIGRV